MCGRFTLTSSVDDLMALFDLDESFEITPRYNIAPRQPVLAVRAKPDGAGREIVPMQWWLIPSWSKKVEYKYPTFNAVSETVHEKPSFRTPFKKGRRCIIPADGFYEWQAQGKAKQPYFIHKSDRSVIAMAGLWEYYEGDDGAFESCTILTCEANDLIRPIHARGRMPVILDPANFEAWLDPASDPESLKDLFQTYPNEAMAAYPVDRAVGRVGHDQPTNIEPLAG